MDGIVSFEKKLWPKRLLQKEKSVSCFKASKDQSESESVSHSVMSDSLQPHGMWPARLLCPGISTGKNIGVGSCSLLQGIFSTQDQTWVSCMRGRFLQSEPPEKPLQGPRYALISWRCNRSLQTRTPFNTVGFVFKPVSRVGTNVREIQFGENKTNLYSPTGRH